MEIKSYFQKQGVKRFLILALLCLILFSIRSMLNVVLLTFLITFLMDGLYSFVTRQVNKVFKINKKVILALIYIVLVTGFVIGIYKVFPVIVNQVAQLINLVINVYHVQHNSQIVKYIVSTMGTVDVEGYAKQGFDFLLKVSNWGINLLLAIILSLFFLLEKEKVVKLTRKFKTSKLGWLFEEVGYFGRKFVHTFGKVIEAQFLIAIINCILSTIALWIMGFPYLFGLALMVFILGLIPVAGVIISLVPLCLIAFSIGGFIKVIYIVVLVIILHSIESYVLNPKLMASKTNLPMFYTFVVLIFSEHFIGVWGLIIGIPIFVFLLDLIDVKPQEEKQ